MRDLPLHPVAILTLAFLLAAPWTAVYLLGIPVGTIGTVAITGLAILGASFLLAWAAETAEKDVPPAFAIAVLAILAVAPEYAVDALFAWQAGAAAGTPAGLKSANLAVANMTGANRILIGLGWSGIALFGFYRARQRGDVAIETRPGFLNDRIHLDPYISTEIVFLLAATAWAFVVPYGGIGWFDTLVLVGLYVAYILMTLRGPRVEEEKLGVPLYLQDLRKAVRIPVVLGLFAVSGFFLVSSVEPFAHGLIDIGTSIGVSEFLMIQWVAPLASETPELIVVAYLVNKARTTPAFNTLISSKLNQWTLLIGTLVVVYTIARFVHGHPVGPALPLDQKQAGEIWLTAAQSYFAIAILTNLRISIREALVLLVLFVVQLLPRFHTYEALLWYSGLYLLLGTVLLVMNRRHIPNLWHLAWYRLRGKRPPYPEGHPAYED